MLVRANGLDYAFSQGERYYLTAMAHGCPKQSLLGDERKEIIQDKAMQNLFLLLPLRKAGSKPWTYK